MLPFKDETQPYIHSRSLNPFVLHPARWPALLTWMEPLEGYHLHKHLIPHTCFKGNNGQQWTTMDR
jgi:hypothetical protein